MDFLHPFCLVSLADNLFYFLSLSDTFFPFTSNKFQILPSLRYNPKTYVSNHNDSQLGQASSYSYMYALVSQIF